MKSSNHSRISALLLSLTVAVISPGAADYATPYAFSTLAGVSSIGSQDGTGAGARFFSPKDVATDSSGNVFIVDEGNHTIRKMTPAGIVTTFAGTAGLPGSADGTGAAARFDSPQGIVSDAANNLYVTDTGNHTIRKISPTGEVTTFAGLAGVTGRSDGNGTAARFDRPRGIARDATGNLYVTESGNGLIRKITPQGVVSTFATAKFPESSDLNTQAPLHYGAIAVDAAGNVHAATFAFRDYYSQGSEEADYYYHYVGYVVKIAPDGTSQNLWQTSIREYEHGRVVGGVTSDLAFSPTGQLVIASNHSIMRYSPADNSLTVLAGDGTVGGSDGPATSAHFGAPFSLTYDNAGTLYIADTGNNNVRKLDPSGAVTTVAGIALENATGTVDGTGSAARFANLVGTAVDAAGNVFVADYSHHCIRKVTPVGVVTTLAGMPGEAGTADGIGGVARFSNPMGITIDANGTLYVTDSTNHTIRKISPAGETSTFAGSPGNHGWADGQGAAAQFWHPRGIAADLAGNLYVASQGTVRKISPSGLSTTLAGFQSEVGYVDATGSNARFTIPDAIAVDASGTVFVSEGPDGPAIARIRKITPDGRVSTLAGAEQGSADGSGPDARFHNPHGLALDASGNLFVADSFNQTVRKITAQGMVSTVAGLAEAPGSADGAGRDARFYFPWGIAVDRTGNLYVTGSTIVRKGIPANGPLITTQPQNVSVAAGGSAQFSVVATGTPAPSYQWQFNGSAIAGATGNTLNVANASAASAGAYTVVVANSLGSVTSNAATLTVTGGTTQPPPPPPPASGGGGGGGAPSLWFFLALLTAGAARALRRIRE